jgi:translation elongation factor P/translation initiation factor 5A
MDKVTFIEIDGVEHAIIDRGNDEFTSMTKEHWDELEAAKAEIKK